MAFLDLVIECFQAVLEFLRRMRGRGEGVLDREDLPALPEHLSGIQEDQRPPESFRVVPEVLNPVRARHYYAVAIGRRPGIYESWVEAAEQVSGYRGSVHKAFSTRAEAEFFLRRNRNQH
jgi:hypothetical protein